MVNQPTPLICYNCGNMWEAKGKAYLSLCKRWIAMRGNIQSCPACGKADKIELLKGARK